MTTRDRRNQGNGEEDAAAPAIASDVLRSLVMSVTQAITTDIANGMVPVLVTPKIITYSSVIDLYNDKSFKTKTKEGKYRRDLTTKAVEG